MIIFSTIQKYNVVLSRMLSYSFIMNASLFIEHKVML